MECSRGVVKLFFIKKKKKKNNSWTQYPDSFQLGLFLSVEVELY